MAEKRVRALKDCVHSVVTGGKGHTWDGIELERREVWVPTGTRLPEEFHIVWNKPDEPDEPPPHQCEGLRRAHAQIEYDAGSW